jgi:phosphohistidine swiveling domain-containing protein
LWIKGKQIYIFQSRPITSWNNTIYSNSELIKFHWKYSFFDFDELWKEHDYFSYELIKDIIPCIFINNKIFIKKSFTNIYYIIKYLLQSKNIKNSNFHKEYKLYLMSKYLYKLKHIFNSTKLDVEILKNFYSSNIYSFNLNQASKITAFTWKILDIKTSNYIKIEKLKWKAFFQLEKIKKQYKIDNCKHYDKHYDKYLDINIIASDYLIFNKWKLVNNIPYKNTNIWVYKSVITWTLISKDNINLSNTRDNILFLENFDIEIYEILDKIKWIIIKNWNQLSHNSIVVREYKIPCIIQYDKYNTLQEWKKITLE